MQVFSTALDLGFKPSTKKNAVRAENPRIFVGFLLLGVGRRLGNWVFPCFGVMFKDVLELSDTSQWDVADRMVEIRCRGLQAKPSTYKSQHKKTEVDDKCHK